MEFPKSMLQSLFFFIVVQFINANFERYPLHHKTVYDIYNDNDANEKKKKEKEKR